ncbi:hypothetical protein ACGFZQ_45395 [Streptomyces sp. NPDC048254]|uniref:hypothetical protein n=1 Tax=Streptomyces sp. NPDC048254 TaxID=3365525 RepID=UPI00370FF822
MIARLCGDRHAGADPESVGLPSAAPEALAALRDTAHARQEALNALARVICRYSRDHAARELVTAPAMPTAGATTPDRYDGATRQLPHHSMIALGEPVA